MGWEVQDGPLIGINAGAGNWNMLVEQLRAIQGRRIRKTAKEVGD
jgi:hypothetical protein